MKRIIYLTALVSILFFVPNLWAQDFVVVKRDIKFFPTVESQTPFFQPKASKEFISLELLEEKAKRVRVKLHRQQLKATCYQNVTAPSGMEFHFWIDRSDLENVTNDVVSFTFKDKSKVQLAPGLVVRGDTVFPGISSMKLKVPKDKTAFSYKRSFLPAGRKYKNQGTGTSIESLKSKKGIRYDSNKYFKKSVFNKAVKDGRFYEVKTKCFHIRGRMKNPKMKSSPAFGFLSGGGFGRVGGLAVPTFTKSATMFSEKGESIGTFTFNVPVSTKPTVSKKFICQEVYLLGEKAQICSNVKDVKNRFGINNPIGKKKKKKVLKGMMQFSDMKIRGDDPDGVKKVLRRKARAFKFCYDRELQKSPALTGKVSIQAKISPDGKVKSTTIIQSDMNAPGVETCLLRVVKRVRFAKSKTETTANIPFKFWSEETAPKRNSY